MANTLILNAPQIFNGIGTLTNTVAATGNYNISLQSTEVPPSGISIVVKNGVTTIFTAPALSATQGALQFKFSFQATAADVITVILDSATASDLQYNTVKTSISIGQGF